MENLIEINMDELEKDGFVLCNINDDSFQKIVKDCNSCTYQKIKNDDFPNPGFFNTNMKPRQMVNQHYLLASSFRELLHHKGIRRLAKKLYPGKRIYVDHSKVSVKFRSDKMEWDPHQDMGYGYRTGKAVAVFLEDCDVTNGTIELFPGSHKLGLIPHLRSKKESQAFITNDYLKDLSSKPVSGKRGDVLVFDLLSIHKSGNTNTDSLRAIFIFEIRPYTRYLMSDGPRIPFMIVGRLNLIEKAVSYIKFLLFGVKNYFKFQINKNQKIIYE